MRLVAIAVSGCVPAGACTYRLDPLPVGFVCSWIDVLPGLKSRDSGLGRLTLPGASRFTTLCRDLCPGLTGAPRGVWRLRPSGGDDAASFEEDVAACVVVASCT